MSSSDRVTLFGRHNCVKLSNGNTDVIVATDVGPRILGYSLSGGTNMLGEAAGVSMESALGEWKAYGGHRLWAAPEVSPRTIAPDNDPVEVITEGHLRVHLIQPIDKAGLRKEMSLELDPEGSVLTIWHRIKNCSVWDVELAPWSLTIMAGGGTAIVPQEPYKSHDDDVLPARPLVLWSYTDLSDPRFTVGGKYIRLRSDPALKEPQKFGVANKRCWAGYLKGGTLFVKDFAHIEGETYPDFGCNNEVYTAGSFMELESLGPMVKAGPDHSVEHRERWWLFDGVNAGDSEESLDTLLAPILLKIPEIK